MSSGWVIVHWSGGAVADINFTFYATKDSSLELTKYYNYLLLPWKHKPNTFGQSIRK